MADRTHDGRPFRILNIIDEFTKECLASFVARRIRSQEVIFILADLFIEHGADLAGLNRSRRYVSLGL